MKTTRIIRIRHPRLKLVLGIAGAACLLVVLALSFAMHRISGPMSHQQAADRWQGGGTLRYQQISVFRSVDGGLSAATIEAAGEPIKAKLEEAGIPDASYLIAYGAEASKSAVSENGKASLAMTMVGGDFFQIHNFSFLSGAPFQPEDVMQDRVVLDELAAWQLFSSNNCVGMEVVINGKLHIVAGVVAQETDRATKECYGDAPRAYVSYSYWNTATESGDAANNALTPVTFCEAVLPEPVDEFAISTLASAISVDKSEIVNNTARYGLEPLLANLNGLHMQGILSNAVVYPYWESAARLSANRCSLLLIPIFIFLLLPAGWAVYGLVCLWRLIKAGGHGVVSLADCAVERRRTRIYLQTQTRERQSKERKEYDDQMQSLDPDALSSVGGSRSGDDAGSLRR